MAVELRQRTATDLAALISAGEVSVCEVIDAHLDRIDNENNRCNATIKCVTDR
ncbi:MAG: hypothetical protein P8M16_03825 [Acidimicrobiales bacterium]|nr:hypothetical protein [Acidimicrobiales bacterium]